MRDYDGSEYENVESAADFAAVPDAFQRLWTPHRIAYIEAGQKPGTDECPFCIAPSLSVGAMQKGQTSSPGFWPASM